VGRADLCQAGADLAGLGDGIKRSGGTTKEICRGERPDGLVANSIWGGK